MAHSASPRPYAGLLASSRNQTFAAGGRSVILWAPPQNGHTAMALTPRRIDAHDMVEFSIEMDGKSVICFISLEALEDNFGATRQTDAATLKMNLDKIAPVAERVARRTPRGERILVRTEDF